jgi:hypothetical protein
MQGSDCLLKVPMRTDKSSIANNCYGLSPIDRQLILNGLLSTYKGCSIPQHAYQEPRFSGVFCFLECRILAEGSCLLANPYLEPVLTSEFGATTDIRQTPGHGHVIATVLLGSANNGHSPNASERQVNTCGFNRSTQHMHGAVAVSQPALQAGAVLCGQSAILGERHEKAGGKVNGRWQVEDLACLGRFSHPFTGC